jgi:hypothetical protein
MRQARQPLAQQAVDLGVIQAVADLLQGGRLVAPAHPVVEGLEGDAAFGQLALGVFVAVETELGVVREVGAELEEERAEVAVHAVEVDVIDHRRGFHDPRVGGPGLRIAPTLGAHHPRLLLRLADVQHAFSVLEILQVLLRHVVLALPLLEVHHVHALLLGEAIHRRHERLGHRRHRRGRGKALSVVRMQIPHHPAHALQLRHVHIQVHPVDGLRLQRDVIAQHFCHRLWYVHHRLRSPLRILVSYRPFEVFIARGASSVRRRPEPLLPPRTHPDHANAQRSSV